VTSGPPATVGPTRPSTLALSPRPIPVKVAIFGDSQATGALCHHDRPGRVDHPCFQHLPRAEQAVVIRPIGTSVPRRGFAAALDTMLGWKPCWRSWAAK
jgi:hypothetical protein